MGALDAPGLGVEVVGTVADVFGRTERLPLIGDGDNAARGIGRQYESLATQILERCGVIDIDANVAFLEFGIKYFSCQLFGIERLGL